MKTRANFVENDIPDGTEMFVFVKKENKIESANYFEDKFLTAKKKGDYWTLSKDVYLDNGPAYIFAACPYKNNNYTDPTPGDSVYVNTDENVDAMYAGNNNLVSQENPVAN